jgi:hypothetical protein
VVTGRGDVQAGPTSAAAGVILRHAPGRLTTRSMIESDLHAVAPVVPQLSDVHKVP